MNTNIEVIQADINKPLEISECLSEDCPIAESFKRVVIPECRVVVGKDEVSLWKDDIQHTISLPKPARTFVQDWGTKETKPFSFEVDIPDALIQKE